MAAKKTEKASVTPAKKEIKAKAPKVLTATEITEEQFEAKEEVNEIPEGADYADVAIVVDEPKSVEDALESVDTTINIPVEETTEDEERDEISKVVELSKELEKSKEEFNESIESNPEKAEEIIKDAIKKAESLKEEVEKITVQKPMTNSQFTNFWNGQIYDF